MPKNNNSDKFDNRLIICDQFDNIPDKNWSGFNYIWKSFAPLKAQTTALRLVLVRLPTKINLNKHFPLVPDELRCCCYRLSLETAEHLFISCNKVSRLWDNIAKWIGVRWASPGSVQSHFEQFACLFGGGKARNRLGELWICATWVLWKWRNSVIFNQKEWEFTKIEMLLLELVCG